MNYTVALSQKLLIRAEVQQRFDDLETAINTTLIPTTSVEKQALEYRHLLQAPKFGLMDLQDPITYDPVAYGGWYATSLVLKHDAQIANANNQDGTPSPVLEVAGALGAVDIGRHTAVRRACIGVSNDGGTTWTPLDGSGGTVTTVRTFGDSCGEAQLLYGATTFNHYITGAANYRPINFPSDRQIELLAFFGGERSFGDPTAYNAYCLMIDAIIVSNHGMWGWIELNAREDQF